MKFMFCKDIKLITYQGAHIAEKNMCAGEKWIQRLYKVEWYSICHSFLTDNERKDHLRTAVIIPKEPNSSW
jgi:hypothetical protein